MTDAEAKARAALDEWDADQVEMIETGGMSDLAAALRALLAERQAPTPTDDEHEALQQILRIVVGGPRANRQTTAALRRVLADAGFRRQPSAPSGMTREALADLIDSLRSWAVETHGAQARASLAWQAADALVTFPVVGQAPIREDWSAQMDAERERQIAKGYDDAHDREHGAAHLLNWAIDYARRGDNLAAATMIRQVLRQAPTLPTLEAVLAERERAARHADEGYRDGYTCDDIAARIRSGEPALLSPEARSHTSGSHSDV